MKNFEELQASIIDWADTHHLLCEENVQKQFMKFVEEVFEFKTEMDNVTRYLYYYKKEHPEKKMPGSRSLSLKRRMMDEMGDIFVTLIILCEQLNISPQNCLAMAYEKIKDRKGKTINGQFIKEVDL